jgi:hypothetical protein
MIISKCFVGPDVYLGGLVKPEVTDNSRATSREYFITWL